MSIIGDGNETYLYVNGISSSVTVRLHENVELIPVAADFHYSKVSELLKNDVDFAIAALSGRNLAAQMRIVAPDSKSLAISAWNAQWDALLLGAIFNCIVMCNIQSDQPIENLEQATYVNVTNYEFRALLSDTYDLSQADVDWVNDHYSKAYTLLDNDAYRTACHAMATYKWHSMPRVQLAILWSGIEALFNASTEISFRISLYIANFLANDTAEAKIIFEKIKKLYSSRSAAVHGGKLKGDINEIVYDSATLLNRIIRCCAERGLPKTDDLVFRE